MAVIRTFVINDDPIAGPQLGTVEPGNNNHGLGSVTQREFQILVMIGRGADNNEIARISHISKRTVETHVYHIYSKLGLKNRSRAAIYAIRHGLVEE